MTSGIRVRLLAGSISYIRQRVDRRHFEASKAGCLIQKEHFCIEIGLLRSWTPDALGRLVRSDTIDVSSTTSPAMVYFSVGWSGLAILAALALGGQAAADSNTTLPVPEAVSTGQQTGVVGKLRRPAPGGDADRASIVVLVMHAQTDYWDCEFSKALHVHCYARHRSLTRATDKVLPCTELPKRGFTTLCANNAASKLNIWQDDDLEFLLQDVLEMVGWLRNHTEFESSKIVLWGHSGGGNLMSA